MKKGQTATEYLIILAVVIIIALIVVGVMGGIPGIGEAAKGRSSAAFFQTADVAISSYANKDAAASFVLNVRNNLRNTITVTSLTVSAVDVHGTDFTLNPGQTKQIAFTTTATALKCTAGDGFSYATIVTYTDQGTGASYNYNYGGNTLDGTCAT